MKTESKRTPGPVLPGLPWQAVTLDHSGVAIQTDDGRELLRLEPSGLEVARGGTDREINAAYRRRMNFARRLVRVVNAHDDLLEAAKLALARLEYFGDKSGDHVFTAAHALRAAIAKVQVSP